MTDTTAYWRPDLSIDQALALKTAAARLAAEFDGTYGPETIERFLHTSFDILHRPEGRGFPRSPSGFLFHSQSPHPGSDHPAGVLHQLRRQHRQPGGVTATNRSIPPDAWLSHPD